MIPNYNHRFYVLFLFMFVLSIHLHPSHARAANPLRDPIVIRVVQLDYANAEHLASVLAPLLTKDGCIVPYAPTNTLIIKDRASMVHKLVTIIKGPVDTEGSPPDG